MAFQLGWEDACIAGIMGASPVCSLEGCSSICLPEEGKGINLVKPEGPLHDGQVRAALHVKEGGFAVGNFAQSNPGLIEDFYEVNKKAFGEGSFGSVAKATDKRTQKAVAVKSIPKKSSGGKVVIDEEVEIMRLLDHPNIVRLLESFEDFKYVKLVMELCEGGELFERIIEEGHFTEKGVARCIQQMLLAVNYLHQNGIVHRDLKPENWLLVTKAPIEEASLKLIDFGVSKRVVPGQKLTSVIGTMSYLAPEVLRKKYDAKADVWSVGAITYVMLSGQEPFYGKDDKEIEAQVKIGKIVTTGKAWYSISSQAKNLVHLLMKYDPEVRPSAVEALTHPWVQEENHDANSSQKVAIDLSQLRSFGKMQQVQKAAMSCIATQLSGSQIEGLKKTFMSMDTNMDGTLSMAELEVGLKQTDLDLPKDMLETMKLLDTDGSGAIDYTEFLAATLNKKYLSQEDTVWAAFKQFDRDGSGAIDRKELALVLGNPELRQEFKIEDSDVQAIDQMFDSMDKDGDGNISFDEFFTAMRATEDEKATKK